MDRRTEQLFDVLEHPGAALIYTLLRDGALIEDELLQRVANTSQSTVNRRLAALEELGVLTRAPGPKQYKDRPWTVAVPDAAESLLTVAMSVTEAVADLDAEQRRMAETELREGRRRRRNLRVVAEDGSESGGADG